MLKKWLQYLTLILLLLSGFSVANAEARIGFVDISQVLKEAPQADAARKKLEEEFAPRDDKIVAMQKKLKQMEEEMATDADIMSEEVRKKKERKIVLEKREIKRTREEFNEDLNIRRNDELNKLQKLVYDTIVTLAKDKDFDIVFGDNVIYASEKVDLSEKVLERLNAQYNSETDDQRN
ncbi:OmpH family outer membrane protein [Thiohalophilus thiocyanatoxydans]|uniref:Periplasmic chaperone for outer membrane proteins Skp n=1 Tax=Thiohalophilus thiocyanatoxydans TaxID=381308 RepID=A0A4R8IHQ7_9GAMM|nr:OmpH family outer membrane protein [Thiohalophilus thiocyanatoxydans]TDY00122.1 periplasmic chaperone for outer membrane proteins Skp [Thiohalophilus thiocyanatoxydans]